jgi:hypothetical protein
MLRNRPVFACPRTFRRGARVAYDPETQSGRQDANRTDVNTSFVGAHIHRAPAGEQGAIVVVQTPDASGHLEGCTTADRDLVKDILKNPEAYCLNVHNVDCPPGVARGQLGE